MNLGLSLNWIQVLTSYMVCLIRGISTGFSNMPLKMVAILLSILSKEAVASTTASEEPLIHH